eukprot:c5606_g1_i2.p1 GENE.c5606_g1_i2~~c5606_g1_i2.p1  ORF type:complete len:647 (-),score=188.39 c5606_g1_i2:293-2233(-)
MANVNMGVDQLHIWCEANLKQVTNLRDSLVNPLLPHVITKQEVLGVINKMDIVLGNTAMLSSLLTEVHPDAQVRNESTACQLKTTSTSSKIGLDRQLYDVIVGVANQTAQSALEDRRFEKLLRTFRRGGVTLASEAQRTRVQNLTEEIDQLSSTYSQNVNADTRYVTRAVNDTVALAGLPSDFIASHTKNGSVVISTDAPDMQVVLKYAISSALRKELHVAYYNRAYPQNLAILSQVLAKRYELAQLLNYTSYAHFAMEEMMVASPANADAFTKSVANATKQHSTEEINQLLALKQVAEPGADKLYGYDSSIYNDQLTHAQFGIGADEIRPYFRYENSRDGVIAIASRMYGLRFERLLEAHAWHSSVEVYDVYWKAFPGNLLGRVYLDMHPRPNKYKHAAQFPIRAGVKGVQVPEGALVCNFDPDNMEHTSVTTLFHEFGHLMHHLLGGADAKYADFSGVATEWDFVEAPSQMFEEWAFDLETLQSFAVNQTKAPIPANLVMRMNTARIFGRSMQAQQQMFYAQLSLQFHIQAPTSFNSTELFAQIQAQFSPYAPVDNTYMLASFGHLMGYSSNYYTYMWSQSIAQHMLAKFRAAGSLLDPHTCLRYRDAVLSVGGQKPASVLVYDFTETAFTLDAFNAYLTQRPS